MVDADRGEVRFIRAFSHAGLCVLTGSLAGFLTGMSAAPVLGAMLGGAVGAAIAGVLLPIVAFLLARRSVWRSWLLIAGVTLAPPVGLLAYSFNIGFAEYEDSLVAAFGVAAFDVQLFLACVAIARFSGREVGTPVSS
jgi:hypothetical protein